MVKKKLRRRKGYTLLEVLAVVVIISIVMLGGSISSSKNAKRANRESTSSDLQLFASSLSEAYYDMGAPEDDFERWLTVVQDSYLSVKFDMSSIESLTNGYKVTADSPKDPWGSPYVFWFITDENLSKYALIASGGENCTLDDWDLGAQSFGDDILAIVRPKV